jgi:hypothetical protein
VILCGQLLWLHGYTATSAHYLSIVVNDLSTTSYAITTTHVRARRYRRTKERGRPLLAPGAASYAALLVLLIPYSTFHMTFVCFEIELAIVSPSTHDRMSCHKQLKNIEGSWYFLSSFVMSARYLILLFTIIENRKQIAEFDCLKSVYINQNSYI